MATGLSFNFQPSIAWLISEEKFTQPNPADRIVALLSRQWVFQRLLQLFRGQQHLGPKPCVRNSLKKKKTLFPDFLGRFFKNVVTKIDFYFIFSLQKERNFVKWLIIKIRSKIKKKKILFILSGSKFLVVDSYIYV